MERTITTLPLEDVYPNEKNYREVTDEGVASIAASIGDAGQRTPIEVWQDGDIYWVVDGNHRLLAMKKLGLTEIAAVVVPHPSDAEYVVNSVASNVAIPVTPLDKSHGAQMMFATGVRPESIAAQLGTTVERATKAKRGYTLAKDYAEDMSIERLEALADFDGDEDASKRIMTAPEASWRNVVNAITAEKARAAATEKALGIIKAAGCELVDEQDRDTMTYITQQYASQVESAPEGAKWARFYEPATLIYWYGERVASVETPEAAAAREERDNCKAAHEAAHEKRVAFLLAHLTNNGPVTNSNELRDLAVDVWEEGGTADADDILPELREIHGFTPRIYAALLSAEESTAHNLVSGAITGWYLNQHGAATLAYFDALKAVGYETGLHENIALDAIRAALMTDCPDCKGDGRPFAADGSRNGNAKCETCNGTGKVGSEVSDDDE